MVREHPARSSSTVFEHPSTLLDPVPHRRQSTNHFRAVTTLQFDRKLRIAGFWRGEA
jgi:hypothetical protein